MNTPPASDDPLAKPAHQAAAQGPLPLPLPAPGADLSSGGRRAEEARQALVRAGRFLYRRWWLLLLITGGLLAGVYRFAQSLPRSYACTPVVMELTQDPPQGARSLEAYEYAVAGLAQIIVPTQQAILKTGKILDDVVRELKLESDPEYSSLAGRVQTTTDPSTSLISLTVKGPDPEKNAAIANAIASVYATRREKDRREYLENLIRAAEAESAAKAAVLKAAEEELQKSREADKVSDLQAEETSSRIRLTALYSAALAAETERAARQAELHEIEDAEKRQSDLADVGTVRENPDVKAAQAEIYRLKQQERTIELSEGDVTKQARQLELVREQLKQQTEIHQRLVAARVADVKNQARESALREEKLGATLETEQKKLDWIVQRRLKDDRLRLEVERAQRQVSEAKSDMQGLNELQAHSTQAVRIWQQAQPSSVVVSPNFMAIYVGGLILALLAALLFSVVLDLVSTRLHDPAAISAAASAPFLGIVPLFPVKKDDPSPTRRILEEVDGESTDAFRLIAYTALLRGSEGDAPRTLLVTSPQAGDGKTTTAFGLASAMARSGLKVLLVDADLRKPFVHRALEIPSEPGLTLLFSGRDVWAGKRVVEMRSPGHEPVTFDVLPSGVLPPNPADLLAGPLMRAFLGEVTRRYAVTIIDSPPINLVSDGCLLASMVDGVVLVTRSGRTHRGHIHRAVSLLRRVRARVRGVLLNGARPNRGGGYGYRYGYGHGYGYGYGYGYGKGEAGSYRQDPAAGALPDGANGSASPSPNGSARKGQKGAGPSPVSSLRAQVQVLPVPGDVVKKS